VTGLDLTVKKGSQSPVTIDVASTSSSLVSGVKDFVSAYNSIRTTLSKLTAFDSTALTTGLLFGSAETLRVESDLTRLIGARYFGVGQFDSLASVGISLDKDGKMQLDQTKLTAAFTKDPQSVKSLFADDTRGVAKKLSDTLEQLAGAHNSILSARAESLTNTIAGNNDRISQMSDRLDKQRQSMLADFNNLETTISKLKNNLNALASLQLLPPLTSTSTNTGLI
jgi:flagellar hook-associated protein 2